MTDAAMASWTDGSAAGRPCASRTFGDPAVPQGRSGAH